MIDKNAILAIIIDAKPLSKYAGTGRILAPSQSLLNSIKLLGLSNARRITSLLSGFATTENRCNDTVGIFLLIKTETVSAANTYRPLSSSLRSLKLCLRKIYPILGILLNSQPWIQSLTSPIRANLPKNPQLNQQSRQLFPAHLAHTVKVQTQAAGVAGIGVMTATTNGADDEQD